MLYSIVLSPKEIVPCFYCVRPDNCIKYIFSGSYSKHKENKLRNIIDDQVLNDYLVNLI